MKKEELIKLLKHIKKHKQKIITTYEKQNPSYYSYVDYAQELESVSDVVKSIVNHINKEAKVFQQNYNESKEMIKAVERFFEALDKPIEKLLKILQNSLDNTEEDLDAYLVHNVADKVLFEYIIWLEKLEYAVLEIGDGEVVFMPQAKIEMRLIEFIIQHSQYQSSLTPLIVAFGMGYLLGDM